MKHTMHVCDAYLHVRDAYAKYVMDRYTNYACIDQNDHVCVLQYIETSLSHPFTRYTKEYA